MHCFSIPWRGVFLDMVWIFTLDFYSGQRNRPRFLLPLTTLRGSGTPGLLLLWLGFWLSLHWICFLSWWAFLVMVIFNYLFGFGLAFLCFVWCFSSVWAEVFVSTAGVCLGLCHVSPFFIFSKMVNHSKQHITPPMIWILSPWSLQEPLEICFK